MTAGGLFLALALPKSLRGNMNEQQQLTIQLLAEAALAMAALLLYYVAILEVIR